MTEPTDQELGSRFRWAYSLEEAAMPIEEVKRMDNPLTFL